MKQGYHDGMAVHKGLGADVALNLDKLNPIQRRIVVALQTMRRKPEYEQVNFTKILLKFSKIRATIKDVKEIFKAVDSDNDGFINEEEVNLCLKKLKSDIAGGELSDFFEISAVAHQQSEGKKLLNEKEFLVALAICYVLRGISELNTPAKRRTSIDARNGGESDDAAAQMALATKLAEKDKKDKAVASGDSPTPPPMRKRTNSVTGLFSYRNNDTLQANFDLIVHAYLLFDVTGKGYIAKSDVGNMMKEDGAGEGQFFLQEERWGEMDWNSDGTIEFSEFVYTFSRWVDIDED